MNKEEILIQMEPNFRGVERAQKQTFMYCK